MVDLRDDTHAHSPVERYEARSSASARKHCLLSTDDLGYERRRTPRGLRVIRSGVCRGPDAPLRAYRKTRYINAVLRLMVVITSAGIAVGLAGCGASGPQQEAAR